MSSEKSILHYKIAISLYVLLIIPFALFSGCAQNVKNGEVKIVKDKYAQFLSSYGWKTSDEPFEVGFVTLPKEFDEVYRRYNDIQLSQGFDIMPYMGKTLQKRVYKVYSYPGREDDETIRADVFVADGIIVAADICSTRIDGFLHGVK